MVLGPFSTDTQVATTGNEGERYVPLIAPYNAAMHLGHMASYKYALRYAYDRHVLDIGCGSGYGAHYLASFGAHRVVATDLDPKALNYAHVAYAHPHVYHQGSDGQRLPFANESFDFVFSSQVIEHVASPEIFLAEVKRVLKPGGCCLITTPNKNLFSPNSTNASNKHHISEMSPEQLEATGRAIFPNSKMVGIPQNCLLIQPDGTIDLKPNEQLCLDDFIVCEQAARHCENIILLGFTKTEAAFPMTLPESLSRASTSLTPCFWDADVGQWVELGIYPASERIEARVIAWRKTIRQTFHSPLDNLYRIDIALKRATKAPIQITLRDGSNRNQVLAQALTQPSDHRIHLTFEPIVGSSGREFCLELDARPNPLSILLHSTPQLEYRGNRLAFWTFHQTLPPTQNQSPTLQNR